MAQKAERHEELAREVERLRLRLSQLEALDVRHAVSERALQQSEELYRAVVENVADAIAITVETERVFVNGAFLRIHGLSDASEVLGRPMDQFIVEDDREEVTRRAVGRQHGLPVKDINEYRIRRPDGEIRTVQAAAVAINYKGKPALLAVLRDVTEQKQAEEKIRKLNSELREHVEDLKATNQELEAFNYTVSHDLRVPLVAIDGFSRRLGRLCDETTDDKCRQYIGIIRTNVERMSRLIDDLLAFSRVGRKEVGLATVEIEPIVRSVIDQLTAAYPDRNVRVEIGQLPVASGDATLLGQVLLNLLSNAFKFTRDKDPAVIGIHGTEGPEECVYYVRDNGAGFDMAQAEKLFGVFQRLDGAANFEGTGIGLAIVKRIIDRHRGRVWAEGKPGEGATFYFSLPKGR
jgi:PAS domain S-box-containing protein